MRERIRVIRGDITIQDVDTVVNAANTSLLEVSSCAKASRWRLSVPQHPPRICKPMSVFNRMASFAKMAGSAHCKTLEPSSSA